MMETAINLSQHFSKERQLHGLYELHPKYELCFATLQVDAGTPSDLRTVFFILIIPSLTELYDL